MENQIDIRNKENEILKEYYERFVKEFPESIVEDEDTKKLDEHVVNGYIPIKTEDGTSGSCICEMREYHGKIKFRVNRINFINYKFKSLDENKPFLQNNKIIYKAKFIKFEEFIKYVKELIECIKADCRTKTDLFLNDWTVKWKMEKLINLQH